MAKPLLSLATIFEKSLELLDTDGIEALSARRLAAELKCSTRTLYDQVGKRDDLLRQLINYHFSRLELDFSEQDSWQLSAEHWCSAIRNLILAHPNLSRLMNFEDRHVIVEHVNCLLKTLMSAGFSRALALRSCRALIHATMSLTLTELEMPPVAVQQKYRSRSELLFERMLITEEAPAREARAFQDTPEVFRNTVRWIIAGIAQEYAAVNARSATRKSRNIERKLV